MKRQTWRVEVEWEDSYIELSGWTPIKRMVKNRKRLGTTCHSIGYVLADDATGIMLAGSVNGANATGVVCIPVSQIKKRRRLR